MKIMKALISLQKKNGKLLEKNNSNENIKKIFKYYDEKFIELSDYIEFRQVVKLKFTYTLRLLIWIYTLSVNNSRPFPGAFYNYMLVKQPDCYIIYNQVIQPGVYLLPMVANISIACDKVGKCTLFCRYYIFILRLFVTQNREFKTCICYIARFLHERVRSLPEIIDFVTHLDVDYKTPNKILYKLTTRQKWPIKLDLIHDRIMNGSDVMFSSLNEFFIDKMLGTMIHVTNLVNAAIKIDNDAKYDIHKKYKIGNENVN